MTVRRHRPPEKKHQALEGELANVERSNTEYQKDLAELTERQQRQRDLNKILPETTEYPAFLSAVQGVANVSGVIASRLVAARRGRAEILRPCPDEAHALGAILPSDRQVLLRRGAARSDHQHREHRLGCNPRCRAKRSCSKSTVSRRRSTPLPCRAPRRRPREPSREISLPRPGCPRVGGWLLELSHHLGC